MLRVNHLRKFYGEFQALDDVCLDVEPGQVVGFLGPNGAGKSTTMKIVTGFIPSSGGDVYVDGYDITRNPMEVRRRIGYLPEHTPLYTDMKVREFLSYRARIKGLPRKRVRARVDYVLERCWLRDRERQTIATLSKGYRQRVGIADALVGDPPLLILDEPTIGLDPNQIRKVQKLIRELKESHTIVLSTHILSDVEAVCDHVVIISQGRTVADDSLAGLLEKNNELKLTVIIRADETRDKVSTELRGLPGVVGVTPLEDSSSTRQGFGVEFAVDANPDDVAEAVSGRVAELGWALHRLNLVRSDLARIFISLTSLRGAGDGEAA